MRETLKSYNPANGDLVGELPIQSNQEIEQAITRARQAANHWRELLVEQRAELLIRASDQLLTQSAELGDLLSREMGKPLNAGIGEVRYCADGIREKVPEMVAAFQPRTIRDNNTCSTLVYQPFGVCAAISPWNYPLSMPQWLVLPALMAGNSVILKPSEETPLIAQRYVETLNAFLPNNVLQIVQGADEQGKTLVNGKVDLIAFTGSRQVGKQILASAAPGLKRVILELGGKDPLIVLDDADIEQAALCAVENGFENAGQMCVSTERVYVTPAVADAFERRVAELVAQIKFGCWNEAQVTMGPMINARQRNHVLQQIEQAIAQGARALTGGKDHPERFVIPTVLVNCNASMDIMRTETFGPVLAIQRVANEEEAVRLANDNPYGLGGAVFGEREHALAIARHLQTGMIGINKSCFGANGTPWVGAKQSGYGFHGSVEGHHQFAQVQVISESQTASTAS
ncbi:aldehyde dehydrogenase family protein [Sedimenticola sp.]|uniref:aldehyde dehydrogenase family protein n=1 Tax=Sedimenticola sp. TaxID=1940285 RepID=UPI003D1034EF